MKNLIEVQNRFSKENSKMQLGHLASDLARIASFIDIKMDARALKSVIEEAKYFAEWTATAPGVTLETQIFLAKIQEFVAQKELEFDCMFEKEEWRAGVRSRARAWSDELLRKAGFLEGE